MLQGVKNAGNMMANAGKIRQQQAKLQKILQSIRIVGESNNKKVRVTITGEQKLTDIWIDPELIKFVNDNFIIPAQQEQDMDRQQDMLARGQRFFSAPVIEAMEKATSQVQKEIVKKIQETGSVGDLMSMLQAAGGS
jgi:DNA-binding protein YbaB